jgi:two-component system, cell cycle sensor histidine kinase and response regulator CckA
MTGSRLQAILASSLDSLLEGIQIIDPEWRYLYVNARAAEHGHTSPEALVGRTLMECYPGIEKTPLFKRFQHVMKKREPSRFRTEFDYREGERGVFELRVTPVPEGICIFTLDVSEEERAQGSLACREEELRIIGNNVQDMLLLASPKGRLLYVNPAFERLLGYPRDALHELDVKSFVHSEDIAKLTHWQHVVRAEFRVQCSNGTWVWVEGSSEILNHSPDGLVVGVIRDVTERRIMEQTLKSNDERTCFAMSAARMGVWELDDSSKAIWWSESLEDVCRVGRGQRPKTWDDFVDRVHPDDLPRLLAAVQESRDSGSDFHTEFRFIPPDGKTIWLQGWGRFAYDETNTPKRLLGVSIDVTERRAIEAQFRQAQKAEAIGRLAGGVAHDFNNLLTVITGFGEFVAAEFQKDDPRRQDIGEVLAAAGRAKALTRQLLAFSRKQVMQPTLVSLNSVVAGMERMLARLIGEDVQVETRLSSDPGLVFIDVHQIEQVIANLVVNARDAMPSGGALTIETFAQSFQQPYSTREFVLPSGRYIVLSVTDTGTGMDEQTRSKVFEPFFTTKGTKGTGLGLASVYGSVKQLDGFINVYSEVGHGTTFKIYFPRRDGRANSLLIDETSEPVKGSERILVVEDEDSVRTLIVRMLTQLGYQTIVAESPGEACLLVEGGQASFDLLLTDVVMPHMNGVELVERIRRLHPGTRVLFVSGYSQDSLSAFRIANPMTNLLQKPFDIHALADAVRRGLASVPV